MRNSSKIVKAYALFTQGIIGIILLGVLGYFIGHIINKDGILKGVLAIVGVLIGVLIFIRYMIYIGGDIDG